MLRPPLSSIEQGAAKCLWACAWSQWMEDVGRSMELSGREILDVMPPVPECVKLMGREFVQSRFGKNAHSVYRDFIRLMEEQDPAHRTITEENFGHYAVMQARGEGVGLFDFAKHDLDLDLVEGPYLLRGVRIKLDGSRHPTRRMHADLVWSKLRTGDFLFTL